MSEYDGTPRPLPYPLQNPLTITGYTEEDADCEASSFVWPEDSDEKVLVPFLLSLNEYNVLSNTIDVGRDIAYGTSSIAVLSLWLRNMRCNVSICDMVAHCFANDPEFRESVIQSLMSDPSVVSQIVQGLAASDEFNTYINEKVSGLTIEAVTGALFKEDCDNSVVAGRVIQIVDVMDQNNIDFFEIVEVGTNDEERVAAMLGAIPVLGMSPVDEVLDMAQNLLSDIWENYAAAVTLGWKNEVAEDLYCLAKQNEDCALTYQELFDYFQQRAGSNLTVSSIVQNVFSYIVNGDFSTDDLIASGMYAIQLAFILAGQSFNGLNLPTLGALTRDSIPSSAWEDWDECGDPPSSLWEIVSCGYGSFVKNSGPDFGTGTYSFTFTSDYWPVGAINLGYFRWWNPAQKFVVNSISVNVTGSPEGFVGGVGTAYHVLPGSTATCANQSGQIEGLPIADSSTEYGGLSGTTFAAYPWEITMNITVSDI